MLLVFILSLCSIPLAGMDFMASMDEGVATISVDLPNGTDLDTTEETTLGCCIACRISLKRMWFMPMSAPVCSAPAQTPPPSP